MITIYLFSILLKTFANSANSKQDTESNICQSLFSLKNKFILCSLKGSIKKKNYRVKMFLDMMSHTALIFFLYVKFTFWIRKRKQHSTFACMILFLILCNIRPSIFSKEASIIINNLCSNFYYGIQCILYPILFLHMHNGGQR